MSGYRVYGASAGRAFGRHPCRCLRAISHWTSLFADTNAVGPGSDGVEQDEERNPI